MSKLVLIPTPVGNLSDITIRALEVLKEVDVIYCEDTRVTGKLLKHFEISKPLRSLHQHNENTAVSHVVSEIQKFQLVAYCSDAGTPGISDPGFVLVRACIEEGIPVECLPGPTALIPALVISGLPCERFVFEGFLPHKKGRVGRITALLSEKRTAVFYESTHRIHKTVLQMRDILGNNRRIVICREISKMHEECIRGTLEEVYLTIEKRELKGEIVLIVEGNNE